MGLVSRTFQFWDRPTLRLVAEFDFARLAGETEFPFVVQTEQHKLANMAIERLRRLANADVHGSARCRPDPGREPGKRADRRADFFRRLRHRRRRRAQHLRKLLDIEFEGYTWLERFLVITTKFDFQAALGCCLRNYMADPEEWTNLFKVAGDDLGGPLARGVQYARG